MELLRGTCISIHASAREATIGTITYTAYDMIFQSTPPRGRRRPGALQTHKPSPNFNPRLREGGDPNCRTSTTSAVYFNPRLREGGDHPRCRPAQFLLYFNPRLREGGDHPRCRPAQFLLYFNPRLREGGDRAIHQPV